MGSSVIVFTTQCCGLTAVCFSVMHNLLLLLCFASVVIAVFLEGSAHIFGPLVMRAYIGKLMYV